MRIFRLNLRLFGEDGGADAHASEGATGGSAAPSLATKEKNPTPRVLYGKQSEAQVTEPEPSTQPQEKPEQEESFADLIAGKYKADYERSIQEVLAKRAKSGKKLESDHASALELVKTTAKYYGLDPESKTLLEDVRKAQENDDELISKQAFANGRSVEEEREHQRKDRELQTLTEKVAGYEEQERQRTEAKARAEWVNSLRAQAPEVQKRFPNFNLDEEMKDKRFASLVRPGSSISLEDAMYAVHHREILSGAVKTAAEQGAQKTANAVAANKARPAEAGLSNAPATIVKSDPSQWTKQDRAEIRRRVARGEKIKL